MSLGRIVSTEDGPLYVYYDGKAIAVAARGIVHNVDSDKLGPLPQGLTFVPATIAPPYAPGGLYWDANNHYLGVDQPLPTERLDVVDSSGDGAIRIGDTTNELAGIIRYNPTLSAFQGYNGAGWQTFGPGGGGGVSDHGMLSGLTDPADHPQYCLHADAESITGAWTFATHPAGLDHTELANKGTYTHASIDSHLANTSTHFTQAAIDHANILNRGTNSHNAIDVHMANSNIHYLTSDIDLGDLGDVNAPTPTDGQTLTWVDTPGEWQALSVGCEWSENGSDIYFNGGNVGIGTGTPGEELDVVGTIRGTVFTSQVAAPLQLQVAGTGVIYGSTAANTPIGIHTTAPISTIDIAAYAAGTVYPTLTLKSVGPTVADQGIGYIDFKQDLSEASEDRCSIRAFVGSAGGYTGRIHFYTRDTLGGLQERMGVYHDGNVGINYIDPPEILSLGGALVLGTALTTTEGTLRYAGGHFQGRTASAWLDLDSGAGATDKIEEGDSSVEVIDTGVGYVRITLDGADHTTFGLSTTTAMRVWKDNASRQDAQFRNDLGSIRLNLLAQGAASASPYVYFQGDGGSAVWSMGLDKADGDKFKIVMDDSLVSDIGLTINASRSVGICTTNPTETLDVCGETGNQEGTIVIRRNDNVTGTGDLLGILKFGSGQEVYGAGSVDVGTKIEAVASENWTPSQNAAHLIVYTTALASTTNVERMRITSEGLAGIGQDTPVERLDIRDGSSAGAIRIGYADNTNAGTIQYTGGRFQGRNASGWINLDETVSGCEWTVNGSNIYYNTGKVGIGTSSDVAGTLDVSTPTPGNPTLNIKSRRTGIGAGTPIGYLQFAGIQGGSEAAPQIGVQLAAYANEVWDTSECGSRLEIGVTNINEGGPTLAFSIKGDGKVVIGNTLGSSSYHLEVDGTTGNNQVARFQSEAGQSALVRVGTPTAGQDAVFNMIAGSKNWMIGIDGSDSNKLKICDYPYPHSSYDFMTFDHNTDAIGIFQENPVEALHIQGGLKIASASQASAGTIQWDGSNFQGYTGSAWVDLDSAGGGATDKIEEGNSAVEVVDTGTGYVRVTIDGDSDYMVIGQSATNPLFMGQNLASAQYTFRNTGGSAYHRIDANNGDAWTSYWSGAGDSGAAIGIDRSDSYKFKIQNDIDFDSGLPPYICCDPSNEYVGIGTAFPDKFLDICSSDGSMYLRRNANCSSGSQGGRIYFGGAAAGDVTYLFKGALIEMRAMEIFGVGQCGSDLLFYTTPSLTLTPTEKMRIKDDGDIVCTDGIVVGAINTATAGAIEWDGSNFRGYNGSSWDNLDESGGGSSVWTDQGTYLEPVNPSDTIRVGNGSVGQPGYSFAGDPNSGFRLGGTATVNLVVTSVDRQEWHWSWTDYLPYGVSSGNTRELRFLELAAGGTNYVGFKAPDAIDTSTIWTLPDADSTGTQALVSNGSGALSWASLGGSSYWTQTGSDIYYDTGNVAIGTDTPEANREFLLVGENQYIRGEYRAHDNTEQEAGGLAILSRSRGTQASPTALNANDRIGSVCYQGYDGSAFANGALIHAYADPSGVWTTGNHGTYLMFRVTPYSATSQQAVVYMRDSELAVIGNQNTNTYATLSLTSGDDVLTSNDILGNLDFAGIDGYTVHAPGVGARIRGRAVGVWSGSARGSELSFMNCASGSDSLVTNIHIDADGKVAIGHDSPSSSLDVSGPAGDLPILTIKRTDATISGDEEIGQLRFAGTDAGSQPSPQIGALISCRSDDAWASSDCPAKIQFQTVPNGSDTLAVRMTIKSGGTVGIGQELPTERLDLYDGSGDGAIRVGNTSGTNVGTIRWDGANFQGYNGSWINLDGAGATTLNALTDVNAGSPSDGQVLTWVNGSGEWQAATPSGGGSSFTPLIKTGTYTASADDEIYASTAGGAWTLTLPPSPSLGDTVRIVNLDNSFETYNLTIARNSSNIMGVADDMTVNVNASFALKYSDSTNGWVIY